MDIVLALLLVLSANGAPIIAENLLGKRFGKALDCGVFLADGRPLFGHSKTLRGVIAAIIFCAGVTLLFGESLWLGAQFGLYAMLGDLAASFIKRRLAIPASGRALLLDQVPEALLPLWLLHAPLRLTMFEVVLLTVAFFAVEIILSKWLYRWHIRKRPY